MIIAAMASARKRSAFPRTGCLAEWSEYGESILVRVTSSEAKVLCIVRVVSLPKQLIMESLLFRSLRFSSVFLDAIPENNDGSRFPVALSSFCPLLRVVPQQFYASHVRLRYACQASKMIPKGLFILKPKALLGCRCSVVLRIMRTVATMSYPLMAKCRYALPARLLLGHQTSPFCPQLHPTFPDVYKVTHTRAAYKIGFR